MSFVLDNQRYCVCYVNHPSNPKETRFSERDYGRFGGYFEADITETQPLVVQYRLWLQTGELTTKDAANLHGAFATPLIGVK
jgi:Methane oxygenase PmoA